MNTINTIVLNFTVAIIDFLYQGRDFQRFWVLEEIARGTILCFLKCLTPKRVSRFERTRASILDERTFCTNSK